MLVMSHCWIVREETEKHNPSFRTSVPFFSLLTFWSHRFLKKYIPATTYTQPYSWNWKLATFHLKQTFVSSYPSHQLEKVAESRNPNTVFHRILHPPLPPRVGDIVRFTHWYSVRLSIFFYPLPTWRDVEVSQFVFLLAGGVFHELSIRALWLFAYNITRNKCVKSR